MLLTYSMTYVTVSNNINVNSEYHLEIIQFSYRSYTIRFLSLTQNPFSNFIVSVIRDIPNDINLLTQVIIAKVLRREASSNITKEVVPTLRSKRHNLVPLVPHCTKL